jgi:hypothetical protein
MQRLMAILLAAFSLFSLPVLAGTSYYLDRALVGCSELSLLDTYNVIGSGQIEDTGPYTPIEHLVLEGTVCQPECDPETLEPLPTYVWDFGDDRVCDCLRIDIDADLVWHNDNGSVYRTEDNELIHVIRRGSEATGDPSLLVNYQGATFVFREE